MRPSIGIDSGSVAVKGVLMLGEELISTRCEPTATDAGGQCLRLISGLKQDLNNEIEDDLSLCATGYGRDMVPGAGCSISEIFANALGAGWVWRNTALDSGSDERKGFSRHLKFRTIIDVGGQDSKVITFTSDGVLEGFTMNDRCAAGTGRFLQELASVLDLDGPGRLDSLALQSSEYSLISNTCTVFAESEVISMVAGGESETKIAAGIVRSVAERIGEMAESINSQGPILFDGGVAHLRSLRKALEYRLGTTVQVPFCPQHITAIGAAVYARRFAVRG